MAILKTHLQLTATQKHDLWQLHRAIQMATTSGLFDELAGWEHPDKINEFCDLVARFHHMAKQQGEE